jgi:hypothetical protein
MFNIDLPDDVVDMYKDTNLSIMTIEMMYALRKYIISCDSDKILAFLPGNTIFSINKNKNHKVSKKYKQFMISVANYNGIKLKLKNTYEDFNKIYNTVKFNHLFNHFMFMCDNHSSDEYEIIRYVDMKSLNYFGLNSSKKCVMFTTPKKVQVGININNVADVVFMLVPYDLLSRVTYSQCVGRFRRVNNMNDCIRVHNIIYPIHKLTKNKYIHKMVTSNYILSRQLIPNEKIINMYDKYHHYYMESIKGYVNRGQPIPQYLLKIQKYKDVDDYIEKTFITYDDIKNIKLELEYGMLHYARSIFIKTILYDDFQKAVGLKNLKMKKWKYTEDNITPFDMTDEEYLYLAFAKSSTKKYRLAGLNWLKSKCPNTSYD